MTDQNILLNISGYARFVDVDPAAYSGLFMNKVLRPLEKSGGVYFVSVSLSCRFRTILAFDFYSSYAQSYLIVAYLPIREKLDWTKRSEGSWCVLDRILLYSEELGERSFGANLNRG